jgi:DNA-binding PadR family transcriptional regulator
MHHTHDEATAKKWLKESQKGYMRIALLILLSKKPCHGYEMMKEVEDRTEGFWKPTAGGVYPILQSLEDEGYIEGKWGPQKRKRKVYHITESGKRILDNALLKHSQIADSMNALFADYVRDVLGLSPEAVSVPHMPNLFSPFLETEPKSRIEVLELKRKRLRHMLDMLKDELEKVEGRLAAVKKEELKCDDAVSSKEDCEGEA